MEGVTRKEDLIFDSFIGKNAVDAFIQALNQLLAAYRACAANTEDMVRALAAADHEAVSAYACTAAALLVQLEQAEMRRRLAASSLTKVFEQDQSVTLSDLLPLLPPPAATQLTELRHELLLTVTRLQTVQQQALALSRNGQKVVERALRAQGGPWQLGLYSPMGMVPSVLPSYGGRSVPIRNGNPALGRLV